MSHYYCTYHGLHEWSSRMFEKFGYMLLASRENHSQSIKGYIDGLKQLCKKIEMKHKITIDKDRKNDLEELLLDVKYLHTQACKLLKK